MTNKSDELRLSQFRCPYCGARVVSSWNLATTGLVYCKDKCSEGKYLMKPEDCVVDEDCDVDLEFLD